MNPIDIAVIVVYVLGCTALGAWLGSGSTGVKDYFVGERNIPAWAVMISIVATETSAVTFLSVPGRAYDKDFTFLQLAFGYVLARFVVAFILLPPYFRGEILTAYQVLAQRFGGATQKAASVLFLVTRTLASGLRLLLAAIVLERITGWRLPTSIFVIGGSTIFYTLVGGLKGVIWADVLQFFVYLLGAVVALVILNSEIPGGLGEVVRRAGEAHKLRVLDFSIDPTESYTFWAGVIGALVLDTGSHGVDQMMVQRYLSARSKNQAAGALIASGFVIVAQFALFLFLGTAIWTLYKVKPPEIMPASGDRVFSSFIVGYLPVGFKGLIIAAVFSVTMSTVSGALSASASSTVNDLYRPIFPATNDRKLLRISKGLTAFWGLVQIGVALGAIGLRQAIVDSALSVAGFVTGILLGLFVLGLATRKGKVGQASAFVGMIAGLAAVSYVAFGTRLAYPWYALVGSSTVVVVGMIASVFLPVEANATAVQEST